METSDARCALLSRLIDHAPLYPPASLPLAGALEEDGRAAMSPHAFMLARFVCAASLLRDLLDPSRGISVVLDAPLTANAAIESAEAPFPDDPTRLVDLAPEVYVEVPLDDALGQRLDVLATSGLRAKVRCGGASTPDIGALAVFIRACRERGLVFKATAGLDRAVRSDGEHGFLNVLAAVAFGQEEETLAEADPTAFTLDVHAFSWRRHSLRAPALAEARRSLFHSIGSCSFFEPVEELEALGVLPL